jgi:hypothetical protein
MQLQPLNDTSNFVSRGRSICTAPAYTLPAPSGDHGPTLLLARTRCCLALREAQEWPAVEKSSSRAARSETTVKEEENNGKFIFPNEKG